MQYRSEIDGLRALAVLPVILFHAGFEWFSGGFVGVDIFFVISGYLITTIIISEMAEGKFSIVNFYERRARRILPALFFVMAACLPFAWLWLLPNDLKDFGQSLVAVSIFSSNILFWLESGYFATAAELKPLLHTWSLAVEEQYYILFPIFLMLTWRLGIKWVLILLSVVFLFSLGVAQWGAYNKPSATFFLLPTRGWELLVGVFAAFYLKYNAHLKSHTVNQMLSLLGFGMILYSITAFDETTPFPSFYALIPTVGTGLLILCAVPKTYVHKLLSLKFIVGIGLISYSAYLWHQPLFAFARHRSFVGMPDINLIALCVVSLVLAWFSWKFVEAPFRNKKLVDRKQIFIYSSSLLSVFILIGLLTHINKGFGERFPAELHTYLAIGGEGEKARNTDCHLTDTEFMLTGCVFGDQPIPPKYALIGDSHALSLLQQMEKSFSEFNRSFVLYSKNGCPPSLLIESTHAGHKNCPMFNQNVIDDLVERKIKTVILFSRFSWYLEINGFKNSYGVREDKNFQHFIEGSDSSIEDQVDEKLESMRGFIRKLTSQNVRVLIIEPIPEMGWDVVRQKIHSLVFDKPMLAIDKKSYEVTTKRRFEKFAEPLMAVPNIRIVATSDLFCDIDSCFGERNGGLLYYDDDHPSDSASQMIVERIIENLF
jgi:peptidoglycan/LPS O-acetylase OafA/YrhL